MQDRDLKNIDVENTFQNILNCKIMSGFYDEEKCKFAVKNNFNTGQKSADMQEHKTKT